MAMARAARALENGGDPGSAYRSVAYHEDRIDALEAELKGAIGDAVRWRQISGLRTGTSLRCWKMRLITLSAMVCGKKRLMLTMAALRCALGSMLSVTNSHKDYFCAVEILKKQVGVVDEWNDAP